MSLWSNIQTATRPIAIIGSGVLGRRLAMMWCSTGKPVNVYDKDSKQLRAAEDYVDSNVGAQTKLMNAKQRGLVTGTKSLEEAVRDAWMVIEAIPEVLDLKITLFGELDRLVGEDCILASNSSSYRSSQMLDEVRHKYVALRSRSLQGGYGIAC
jgi:3-hydroxyacyl-CoA dehydrogenase